MLLYFIAIVKRFISRVDNLANLIILYLSFSDNILGTFSLERRNNVKAYEDGYYWMEDKIVMVKHGSYFRFMETRGQIICDSTPELIGPIRKPEKQQKISKADAEAIDKSLERGY